MENQLENIVKKNNLTPSKAKYILEQFTIYFKILEEWEKKAKDIVVTDDSQVDIMAKARERRLFVRSKRIAIEQTRKTLKEESLRQGKAVDGIANVLKAIIAPIEEHLDRQERFVEIKKETKEAEHRAEVERRMEAERIAQEKKDAEEKERLRKENEKLWKENEEKDRKAQVERKKQQDKLAKERAKGAEERQGIEKKARLERERNDKKLATAKAKARKDKEIADAKAEAELKEKKRLEELLKDKVVCPYCKKEFQLKR